MWPGLISILCFPSPQLKEDFSINKGLQVDIDTAMGIESDMFGMCCATTDKSEGMGAFVEKRKPQFMGE